MNSYGWFLCRMYAGLLSFYPRLFRREFSTEMQAVFEQALVEASNSGQLAAFFMRELRDWPAALLHAHLQERRLKNMPVSSDEKPVRWWGVLAGMGLFLLPMFFELFSEISVLTIPIIFRVGFLVIMLAILLIGIFKGLSRWCLPVVGMVLGIIWMYGGLQLIGSRLVPLINRVNLMDREASRYVGGAIMDGVFWGSLFLICLVFVLVFFLLPPLRTLYRRIRNDWTLVSLTLYGAILFALFIDWDEYTQEHVFVAVCYLFLALGAGGYLLSQAKTSRLVWLLGGASLAMVTMAVGKFILVPMQDWPQWFQWHAKSTERWFESLGSLIELGWILLVLVAPSILMLLPPARESIVETSEDLQQTRKNSAISSSPR